MIELQSWGEIHCFYISASLILFDFTMASTLLWRNYVTIQVNKENFKNLDNHLVERFPYRNYSHITTSPRGKCLSLVFPRKESRKDYVVRNSNLKSFSIFWCFQGTQIRWEKIIFLSFIEFFVSSRIGWLLLYTITSPSCQRIFFNIFVSWLFLFLFFFLVVSLH